MLITYESEAINSRLNGQDIQYVIPRQSMLIELPIAVAKSSPNKDKANKFIRFVKGATAQDIFAQYGFRPVDKTVAKKYADKYPSRPGIFAIDDSLFGGWRKADKLWFDPNKGRMVEIEQERRRTDLWLVPRTPRRLRAAAPHVDRARGPLGPLARL